MPLVSRTDSPPDYIPLLQEGRVHLVGFAEVGLSFFRSYLEIVFGFSLTEAIKLCERINEADETGTIFPRGKLTGMPVRFFRQAIEGEDLQALQRCIKDAFVANRDFCKSREMVFQFNCAVLNQEILAGEITKYALESAGDDQTLERVTLVFDSV